MKKTKMRSPTMTSRRGCLALCQPRITPPCATCVQPSFSQLSSFPQCVGSSTYCTTSTLDHPEYLFRDSFSQPMALRLFHQAPGPTRALQYVWIIQRIVLQITLSGGSSPLSGPRWTDDLVFVKQQVFRVHSSWLPCSFSALYFCSIIVTSVFIH